MEPSIYCFVYKNNQTLCIEPDSTIDELYLFTIIIESKFELNNHHIVLTDIPIELSLLSKKDSIYIYSLDEFSVQQYFHAQGFDRVFKLYKDKKNIKEYGVDIDFYKLFLNYPIGTCEIGLIQKDNFELLVSFAFNISSYKIDLFEFESLVSYVESRGSSIWTKYSLVKHYAKSVSESDRLEWLVLFCSDFIAELKKRYLTYFFNDKITTLENYSVIEDYNENIVIAEDSIVWLLNNSDLLSPTTSYDLQKIIVKNRPFIPISLLSSKLKESTDNNENQLFHGFIEELILFITEVISIYKSEIGILGKEKFDDLVMFYSYSKRLRDARYLKTSLIEIKQILDDEIPVSKSGIDFLNVNKIESKEHYFYVYNKLLQWLLYKGTSYTITNRFFKGITRLDELFERACYYKLLDVILKLGYEPSEGVDLEAQKEIEAKMSFVKKQKTVNLYYQFIPDKLITIKKNSKALSPDFIIEYEESKYIILDSKYKKLDNIEKYDYADLSLKYLHGLAPRDGGRLNVTALFVLFPDKGSIESFYAKDEFSIKGSKVVYPVIGSIGVNFGAENAQLVSILNRILG